MAAHAWWVPYITAAARRRGLDPASVLGIASHEGLSGRAGDQDTSFGPFQLHRGGALPSGRGRSWAESKAGINYALDQMAQVARGLRGRSAITAISTRFERPADPASEIADAVAHYSQFAGGKGNLGAGPAFALASRLQGNGALPAASQGGNTDPRMAIIGALLQQSNDLARGNADPNALLNALVVARQQAQQPSAASQAMASGFSPNVKMGGKGGINELFYDPLGGIKDGKQIGAIGHHGDHVHMALSTLNTQLQAENQARRMGLHVGEERDSDFHNVHARTSYHNRDFPGTHYRMAADVSGDPRRMAAFYRWVAANH